MFTNQAQALASLYQHLPSEAVDLLASVLTQCNAQLEHRGPVTIDYDASRDAAVHHGPLMLRAGTNQLTGEQKTAGYFLGNVLVDGEYYYYDTPTQTKTKLIPEWLLNGIVPFTMTATVDWGDGATGGAATNTRDSTAITVVDPDDMFTPLKDTFKGYAYYDRTLAKYRVIEMQRPAKYIWVTLSGALAHTDAAIASCPVTRWADGVDPGATVQVYNPPGGLNSYFFAGRQDQAFKCVLDREADQYVLVSPEPFGPTYSPTYRDAAIGASDVTFAGDDLVIEDGIIREKDAAADVVIEVEDCP